MTNVSFFSDWKLVKGFVLNYEFSFFHMICYKFQSTKIVGKIQNSINSHLYHGKNMSISDYTYREVAEKFIILWAADLPHQEMQLCHKWFCTTTFPLM